MLAAAVAGDWEKTVDCAKRALYGMRSLRTGLAGTPRGVNVTGKATASGDPLPATAVGQSAHPLTIFTFVRVFVSLIFYQALSAPLDPACV